MREKVIIIIICYGYNDGKRRNDEMKLDRPLKFERIKISLEGIPELSDASF